MKAYPVATNWLLTGTLPAPVANALSIKLKLLRVKHENLVVKYFEFAQFHLSTAPPLKGHRPDIMREKDGPADPFKKLTERISSLAFTFVVAEWNPAPGPIFEPG